LNEVGKKGKPHCPSGNAPQPEKGRKIHKQPDKRTANRMATAVYLDFFQKRLVEGKENGTSRIGSWLMQETQPLLV
jgi:hypothetical protein